MIVHDGRVMWWGETYDPKTDRWDSLEPPFEERLGMVYRSCGEWLVAWSGGARGKRARSGGVRRGRDGAWHAIGKKGQLSARMFARSGWTGRELLLWGGRASAAITADLFVGGGAYAPETDTWRGLSTEDAPTFSTPDTLWTGTEWWLWEFDSMHAYDPATDRWRSLARPPGSVMKLAFDVGIVVVHDGALNGCATWRYEPRADLWEPCAAAPDVSGHPQLVEGGDRAVFLIGSGVYEYLVARDRWAKLGENPFHAERPYGTWDACIVDDAVLVFAPDRRVHRIELPAAPQPVGAERELSIAHPQARPIRRTSPITALAIRGETIAGHADGRVYIGGQLRRCSDGQRIAALAVHDRSIACLVGNALEVLGGGRVELPFVAHLLAQDGPRIVVAGDHDFAVLVHRQGGWTLVAHHAAPETTAIAIALGHERIARTTKGLIELRDVATGAIVARFAAHATTALPFPDGVLAAELFSLVRYTIGKKRPKKTATYHLTGPLATSADGRWLVAFHAGVQLYDLRTGKRLVLFEVPDGEATAIAIDPAGAPIAVGTSHGATFTIDPTTLGVTCTTGSETEAWQPPISRRVDRPQTFVETFAASEGLGRWRIGDHAFKTSVAVERLAILPTMLVGWTHAGHVLAVFDPRGETVRLLVGHGSAIVGVAFADDGFIAWDGNVARHWQTSPPS